MKYDLFVYSACLFYCRMKMKLQLIRQSNSTHTTMMH